MAKMNLDYYTNIDQYSDGDIENQMLEIAEKGEDFESLPDTEITFPIVYHFSKVRQNILNWYPFKEGAAVLEIGAGCGAITGMLCERAARVTSVELSKRRASINFARHQQYDNLEIMVGNLNDMSITDKYDYVVLNGVLEYAAGFTAGETPYQTFLQNMKKYLKEDGRFLIAIENRLGLKYFAGAPEDHTDIYFYGLNHYPDNFSVRTFSKTELQELLAESGLKETRFYYPYPDYKFPTEIFTEDTIKTMGYGRAYKNYSEGKVRLFDENLVAGDLVKEGVAEIFSNSFLVEASAEPMVDSDAILYVKMNGERKDEFKTYTAIHKKDDKKYVTKTAITPSAVSFVNRMGKYSEMVMPGKYENLACRCVNGTIEYPFVEGRTMMECIREYMEKGDEKNIVKLLEEFYEVLFADRKTQSDIYSEEFQKVLGTEKGNASSYECVSPANIDLICDNIFIRKDKAVIIDYEWMFDFAVPVPFIMWRMLNELYSKAPSLNALVDINTMWKRFGILEADVPVFLEWSKHFAYEYVGSDSHRRFARKDQIVDLKDTLEGQYLVGMKLYYDKGAGLNEEDSILKTVKLDGNRFKVRFDLASVSDKRYFRLDILQKPGFVWIDRLDSNCQFALIPQGTYFAEDNKYEFVNESPVFVVDTFRPERIEYLEIEGRLKVYEAADLLAANLKMRKELRQQKESVQEIKADSKNRVQALMNEMDEQTVLSLLKKKLRQTLRRKSSAPGVSRGGIKGCVDEFRYVDQTLFGRGWAYAPDCADGSGSIVYYAGGKQVYRHNYTMVHRGDVAEVLQDDKALKSGFLFQTKVHAPEPVTVVLEFETVSGVAGMTLGEIPADDTVQELYIELHEDRIGNIDQFIKTSVVDAQDIPPEVFGYEIDIIIPVYNGYDFFEELFAGVELTNMRYRLLIVNDKSTDERVLPYLEKYAAAHSNVILMNNEENLGFVKSVNRALREATNHVVLLNTDVAVSYQWLERLMIPIICGEKVATTTPFTTCGTLCSFPQIGNDNTLVGDLSLWQMDDAFRRIKPKYPVIPTGVGFCMGMNIHAINEIGVLDDVTFGKGYGEENDWCRRAAESGYKNVHVDNLFVYHKHGGSFLSEEKQRLIERNGKELLKKHPDYNTIVSAYFQMDPLKQTRYYVLMKLLNQMLDVHTIVAFNHCLGGGADEYLIKKRNASLQAGHKFITVVYDVYNSRYLVDYQYKKTKIAFSASELDTVLANIGRADEVWINELVMYRDLYDVMNQIVAWKSEQGSKMLVLLHDFFPICPAINLMNQDGKYCGVGCVEVCQQCIPANKSNACEQYETARAWRTNWEQFLKASDLLVAFSEITKTLVNKAYPSLDHITVIPHEPHYVPALNKKVKTTSTLNIGLLGILSYKKGLDVVRGMIAEIEKQNLNVRIKLIGEPEEPIDSAVFSQTGRYRRGELPKLTLENDIDIFFIPSICPETFSYTTSEIMSMNMPIAVFDIGAPAERVGKYKKGIVLEYETPADVILQKLIPFANETCGVKDLPVQEEKTLFLTQEVSFAVRYRVEHFQEQLLHHGHASDRYLITEADHVDVSQYKNVVIYRCNDVERVKTVVEKAKNAGIPVYYDIDDFIFAYDEIQYLDFLKDDEYKDFRATTEKIHQCMDMCDGFLTSTETLKKQIAAHFPEKPIVMKRNVASMEMQILSHEAAEEKADNEDIIWIGYFSGSATHNKDFVLVESVLDEIMAEYPNVHLRLGGVIQDSALGKYGNRIEKLSFMEWQKLPKAVASVDINLMPLEDTEFHGCKSENKWTEAALVKVPSVMSRNSEMELVVEDGKTGFLCTEKEEWKRALAALIEDKELRTRVAENANRVVLENYTTYNSGKEAVEFITK